MRERGLASEIYSGVARGLQIQLENDRPPRRHDTSTRAETCSCERSTGGFGWQGKVTSWLSSPTQQLPTLCLRSPQEPHTRSRPAWLADLHGMITPRVGVVVLPFLTPCSRP